VLTRELTSHLPGVFEAPRTGEIRTTAMTFETKPNARRVPRVLGVLAHVCGHGLGGELVSQNPVILGVLKAAYILVPVAGGGGGAFGDGGARVLDTRHVHEGARFIVAALARLADVGAVGVLGAAVVGVDQAFL